MTQPPQEEPKDVIGRELKKRRALETFTTFLALWQFKDRETGEVRSFEPGNLWEGQREFRDAAEEYKWLLALKAGKLGFTEFECAFDAYRLLCSPNGRVHVFSRDAPAAEKLLEYIRFGLTELPDWFGVELLAHERGGDTGHSIKISTGDGGVRTVERYAADKHVSIDATCQHAHVDEFGAMPFQKETWGAVSSTIAPDGTCHVVSRGYGEDVYLTELWHAAVDGGSQLNPLFCDWTKRAGRDEAWLRQKQADNPHGVRFEAPEKPEDCLSGEDTQGFIAIELWDACEGELVPFTPQSLGKTPVVLSCDAAGGRKEGGDTFAITGTTRHPDMHEEGVAIRMARYWEPPFEFSLIEEAIKEFCRMFNVVEITYDPFQLEAMMERIRRDIGVWCIPFDQGRERNVADRGFYDLIIHQRLVHAGDPALREHIKNANVKVEKDQDSKIRLIKKAPQKKIDLAVAASMGAHECLRLLL